MESKKWWQEDWTDELALIVLVIIGVLVITELGGDGTEIVSSLAGGLVGYLKGKKK
jgi:hypothetical protein